MISRENRVIAAGIGLALPAGAVTQILLGLVVDGGTSTTVASAVVILIGVVLPQIVLHRHGVHPECTEAGSGW